MLSRMGIRFTRKSHLFIVGGVLALNVIYFLTSSSLVQSAAQFGRLARRASVFGDQSQISTGNSNIMVTATSNLLTLSTKTKGKVEMIKRYLNHSKSAEVVYPTMIIGGYLMMDPNLCRGVDKVDVVILVHTAPKNLEKRQRMRDSFAKNSLFFPFQVRIAFLLGRTTNSTLERLLWLEHVAHNDTVMGNFYDAYHNLTLKGVMGYQWVSEHCSNSKFVLKIDDDVLINMYKLLYSFTGHMSGKKKSIFCNVWRKSTMAILRSGKWKVARHVFSNMKVFPYDYCSGFVVILTSDLMKPLYEAAKITPFFWIDDVYLFGMLPSVVGGVTYYNYALDKNVTLNGSKAIECTKSQGPKCPIFATLISADSYWSYWNLIKDIYSTSSWNVEQRLVE